MNTGRSRGVRLVSVLQATGFVSGITSFVAAGLLIYFARQLERLGERTYESARTAYAAAETQRVLLLHHRASELLHLTQQPEHQPEQARLRKELDHWLVELASSIKSPIEMQHLGAVMTGARDYLEVFDRFDRTQPSSKGAADEIDRLLSEVDKHLQAFAQGTHQQRRMFHDEAHDTLALAITAGWFVAGIVALTVCGVLWGIKLEITGPFARMGQRIERLKAGHLAPLPLDGPIELQEIAGVLNQLVSKIQHQHDAQFRFLAGIAHDLRTPLNAVHLSIALIKEEGLSADQRESLEAIHEQIIQLNSQIGDLLDTARIECGQLELRPGDHDVTKLVEGSANVFRGSTVRHRIQVNRPNEPTVCMCDAMRIGQVLNNLFSNAIKYSPDGGDITAEVSSANHEVTVAITDRGIGIAPEELPHVFEPFRRTKATRESIAGVGLGLSMARRIAEAHGGAITVTTVQGTGSTFTLSIPRRGRPPAPQATPANGARSQPPPG